MPSDGEDYFLPLQDQRVFGAGIKRKRVPFVPPESETENAKPRSLRPALGDKYLSIVLPQSQKIAEETTEAEVSVLETPEAAADCTVCAVCNLPVKDTSPATARPHESKLAHQVCLSPSYPPSHLARDNVGLRYMTSYGWDPDARVGLGPDGAGIRAPIKSKIKNDTVGLGVKDLDQASGRRTPHVRKRLNAKQVRKQEVSEKERDMQLRHLFYGKDLEAYLGPGAGL